jgi:basic amino acid/polyamine antiporter, APA family
MAIVAVPSKGGMLRELNLFGAVSMIVGIVIGSGIFLGVNRVAAGAGSPALMVLVWVVAGFLTLMGALTYAELGTIFPKAGGEYVFLKEGMGSLAAFMSGWTAFTINLAGSAAALAVIFAEQLNRLKPEAFSHLVLLDWGWLTIDGVKITAACLIGFLSIINYFGVRYGGGVQMVFTALKMVLIVLLAGAALLYLGDASTERVGFFETPEYSTYDTSKCADPGDVTTCAITTHRGFDASGFFGLAMVAALFAYDGWTNVVRVGAELKNPSRNIPRAMLFGLVAIMAMYILVTLGYLNVLGFQGFADGAVAGLEDNPKLVASNAAAALFGSGAENLVAVMILVSVFGALNGITLSGPRIYYAMSVDRLFPRLFGRLNRRRVPHQAILFQALLAIGFLMFFDFNALTDNVVFISFFFYALTAIGLMVLRRTHPDLPRPYRVWGYPYVPLVFIVTSLSFVAYLVVDQVSTIRAGGFGFNDLNRIVGLAVVAAGLPIYFRYRNRLVRQCKEEGLLPPAPVFGPDPYAEQRLQDPKP